MHTNVDNRSLRGSPSGPGKYKNFHSDRRKVFFLKFRGTKDPHSAIPEYRNYPSWQDRTSEESNPVGDPRVTLRGAAPPPPAGLG